MLLLSVATGCKYFRPLMPGSSNPSPSKLVAQYSEQLDIHSELEYQRAEAGFATPVLHVTITNTGDRNVNYLKLVITLDVDPIPLNGDYHDIRVVKPLTGPDGDTTLLTRDGGATSFLVHFNNTRFENLRPNIRLTDIGFTK
jgi:hypothetical protein